MNIQEKAEIAANYKEKGIYNCCQAILIVFKDELNLNEETILKLGANFAIGMGAMQGNCGALIGAQIVSGMLKPHNPNACARMILNKFIEKSGALNCKDLKGIETGQILCSCGQCVKNAIYALNDVMHLDDNYL